MLLPPPAPDINRFLEHAIQLAAGSVADGGGPFGALVVTADGRVHEGVNRVARDNDPTAHAEVVAIRTAAASSARRARSSTAHQSEASRPWSGRMLDGDTMAVAVARNGTEAAVLMLEDSVPSRLVMPIAQILSPGFGFS